MLQIAADLPELQLLVCGEDDVVPGVARLDFLGQQGERLVRVPARSHVQILRPRPAVVWAEKRQVLSCRHREPDLTAREAELAGQVRGLAVRQTVQTAV